MQGNEYEMLNTILRKVTHFKHALILAIQLKILKQALTFNRENKTLKFFKNLKAQIISNDEYRRKLLFDSCGS